MRNWWRQAKAVFAIYVQDSLAYKASAFIWTLTDATTAVTMPLVWAAAVGSGMIQGYTASDFVLYYLVMLLLTGFITCHFMWEVAYEIREGIFSTYLIRPMDYFQFMLARNYAWRLVRTLIFLPLFGLLILAYWGYVKDATVYLGWEAWVSVLLGNLVSFTFVMAIAMVALFVQEAHAIFELYYFPMLFLSGQLFPVSVLPQWAQQLALVFPFYYTTGLPTEIIVGRVSPQASWPLIGGQVAWVVGCYFLQRFLWRAGLRHYTGVGM